MGVWLIIPVKSFEEGKSRLSSVLSPERRMDLNRLFLRSLLEKVADLEDFERVLIISKDEEALNSARKYGAIALKENGVPDLNQALESARLFAMQNGASSILVLPTDLPFIQIEDICQLLAHGREPRVVVIAPDRYKLGTNALLLSPPQLIPFCFGLNSFAKHCDLSLQAGAKLEIYESDTIAFDVDGPYDLEPLLNSSVWF